MVSPPIYDLLYFSTIQVHQILLPLLRFQTKNFSSFVTLVTQKPLILTSEQFGLGGTIKMIQSSPPVIGRGTFHQTRRLKIPSNLALNTSRDETSKISLGNLFQCLSYNVRKRITELLLQKHFSISYDYFKNSKLGHLNTQLRNKNNS